MENKKLKIVIIILMIVLVCITGLCVFLVIDVLNKVKQDSNGEVLNKHIKIKEDIKNNDNTNNNEESDFVETIINNDVQNYESNDEHDEKLVGTISLDNKTVQKLYNYVNIFATTKIGDPMRKDDSLIYKIGGYIFKNNMISKDISDNIKIGLVVEYLRNSEKLKLSTIKKSNVIGDSDCYIIDFDLIRKYTKIIFGEDTDISFDSLPQSNDSNDRQDGAYDNNTKYLAYANYLFGATMGSPILGSKLVDVINDNGNLELYQKTFYKIIAGANTINIYDNYNEDNMIKSFTVEEYAKFISDLGEEKALWNNEEISNNASIYKYIFKYDEANKHYYFYSVEKYK